MEDCTLEEDFSFYLSNVQIYTAFKNRNKAFRDMVEAIKAEIGTNLQAHDTQDGGDLVAPPISSGNRGASSGNEKVPPETGKEPSGIHKWIRPAGTGAVVILLAVLLFSGRALKTSQVGQMPESTRLPSQIRELPSNREREAMAPILRQQLIHQFRSRTPLF